MLYISTNEDPTTLDSQKTTEFYMTPLNIYDRLYEAVTVDGKPELVPGLATSYDISDDGLTYTFHLREGVKFHNGEIFEADDVVYTINRMMDPANQTLNTDFFNMIEGANEMYDGLATEVSGVKAIDSLTVEIKLADPFGGFLANLTTPPASIYNREACEAAGTNFGIDPAVTIGTGPFKAAEWTRNDKIVLTAFEDYWKGAPSLAGITIKIIPDEATTAMAFENGELDILDCDYCQSQVTSFQNSDKWKDNIKTGTEAGLYMYKFNMAIAPYNDLNVRLAVAHAIDRQQIVDTIFGGNGIVVDTMVVEGVLGHNYDFPALEYNPEKAKEYLTAAGFAPGELTIECIADDPDSLEDDMNVAIQGMLADVGINMEIKVIEQAAYEALRADGAVPFERCAWWADYNDPDNFLYSYFSRKNNKFRSNNYADDAILDEMEAARIEVDADKRLQMYQEVELAIVNRDRVIIPIIQQEHIFVLQDNISNFVVSWNGWSDMMFYDVQKTAL